MAETKFIIRVVDQATAGLKNINNHVKSMTGVFSAATKSILSFQTAFGFFTSGLLVRQFSQFSLNMLESADRFERMRLKFAAIGAPDYSKDVIAFARKNPVMDIKDIQDAYVKLYAVGINPTSKALQSLADASAAFGLTGPDVSKVLLAIQQIAGKGIVNMEELRQQLGERIATAVEIMSTKLGYGRERMREFFKDVEQGKISAREGLTALFDGFQERYSGAAESMKNTWAGLMQGMKNEWEIMQSEIMTPEFFQTFKDAISELMQTIKNHSEDIRTILKGIITLFRELIELAGSLANEKSTFRTGLGKTWADLKLYVLQRTPAAWTDWGKGKIAENEAAINALMSEWANNQPGVRAMRASIEASRQAIMSRKRSMQGTSEKGDVASNGMAGGGYFMGTSGPKPVWGAAESYESIKEKLELSQKMFEYDMQVRRDMMKIPAGAATPFVPGTFAEGFRAELQRMEDDFQESFGNMAKMGKESAKIVADAMAGAFNDFFIDAIEGRLQQFKDYLLGFFTSIGRALSQVLSQYLAMQALGYMMPGMLGGGIGGGMPTTAQTSGVAGMGGVARPKAGGSTPSIQIVNNSGVPMEGTASYSTNDMGDTVMTVVMDAVGRNKGGSRDALRAMLAT